MKQINKEVLKDTTISIVNTYGKQSNAILNRKVWRKIYHYLTNKALKGIRDDSRMEIKWNSACISLIFSGTIGQKLFYKVFLNLSLSTIVCGF